jgi:hypothetical protein
MEFGPKFQWNSKAGDLLSPRPEYFIGTSPPSGHAGLVTDNTGRGGGGPPGAAPAGGACAITTAQDEMRAIPDSNARCMVFIRFFSSDEIYFSVSLNLFP